MGRGKGIKNKKKSIDYKYKSIRYKKETFDRLRNFGKFGDTYDGLLNKIMDKAEQWDLSEAELERMKQQKLLLDKQEEINKK